MPVFSGDQMKFNIDELTYEEIREVVDMLRRMKIDAKFACNGNSVVLQTECGPVQVRREEAVEMCGVPAMF